MPRRNWIDNHGAKRWRMITSCFMVDYYYLAADDDGDNVKPKFRINIEEWTKRLGKYDFNSFCNANQHDVVDSKLSHTKNDLKTIVICFLFCCSYLSCHLIMFCKYCHHSKWMTGRPCYKALTSPPHLLNWRFYF